MSARTVAQAPPYPSVEKIVVQVLISLFGDEYTISTIVPDNPTKIAIRVQRISGAGDNIQVDKAIVEVDVITSKHISGTAGYGIADDLSRDIRAALYNQRSLPNANGVIQAVRTIAGPRRIPDINVDTFRFAATYEISVHA
jgi:hypothetical protein